MKITVRFFALFKEISGRENFELDFERAPRCGEVLEVLSQQFPLPTGFEDHCLIAVNGRLADRGAFLNAGDEFALLPPVSGG